MAKILLWISAVLLAVFVIKTQYLTSKTYEPFVAGCVSSGNASQEQCECLSDYVHKRYSDLEVRAIMDNRLGDELSQTKVEQDIRQGSQVCANP
ncbi:hypothetical protein [Neptunomonas japonica]|uniref:Uncharacterized protein n=1 Tax=Neptunomonas japonica JAMM 1380 TaxID=1441457 RepID=A0A7R6PVP2_9GAMM|nr:hypothetical protein [Neptunomonas japonica]BBB31415.1 conserved hypothetical protein [Neptunomonas japonica JAMM 1380]